MLLEIGGLHRQLAEAVGEAVLADLDLQLHVGVAAQALGELERDELELARALEAQRWPAVHREPDVFELQLAEQVGALDAGARGQPRRFCVRGREADLERQPAVGLVVVRAARQPTEDGLPLRSAAPTDK